MKAPVRSRRLVNGHKNRRPRPTTAESVAEAGDIVGLAAEVAIHTETSPRLTGSDLDADWQGAYANGDEAVGGSVATPDQDIVDEIGAALGVPRDADAELVTCDEILRSRDRHRWHLERDAALEDERRGTP